MLGAVTQQPTVSGPGWTSILTDVWADKHHVVDNTFAGYDSANYPILFRRLKAFNPGASLSSIVQWAPLDTYLMAAVAGDVSFRQIAASGTAEVVSDAVAHLASADPDVLFLHFDDVDATGHSSGFSPSNPNYLAAIMAVDAGVGTILSAVHHRPNYSHEVWYYVAVTDHGGTGTSHGGQTAAERTIWVIVSGGDTPARLIAPGPGQVCVAATVLAALGVPVQGAWGMMAAPFGVPLTNSLAVHLNFDNNLSGQEGTTNAGTVYSVPARATPRYVSGRLGQAAGFANTGGSGAPDDWAVSLGSLESIYSNSFSVSLWLRTTGGVRAAVLANKAWGSDNNVGWVIGPSPGADVNWNAEGGTARDVDLGAVMVDGMWHLTGASFNRGANEVISYLDGVAKQTNTISPTSLATFNAGFPTVLGVGGDGAYACAADVDDLGLWSRVLAPEELAEVFAKAQHGLALGDAYSPPPTILSPPGSQTVMQTSNALFSVLAGGGSLAYQWTFAGTNLAGATNATLLLVGVQPSQAGVYAVIITNMSGALTSAPATLTVAVSATGASSLQAGLVAYYAFESQTNSLVPNALRAAGYPGFSQDDAALNGGNLSATNAPPFTTDPNKVQVGTGALDLNGLNAYGNLAGNPINLAQDWTVSAWFKANTGGLGLSGTTRYFVFETAGSTYPISFGLRAGSDSSHSNFQLYSQYASGTGISADYQVLNSEVDKWHQVVVVRRNSGVVLQAFLDGAQTHQISLTSALAAYTGFHVGTYRSADGRWFKGQLDDLAFWQRGLSVNEISNLYSAGLQHLALATWSTQPGGLSLKTNLAAYYGCDAQTNGVMTNGVPALGGSGFANDSLQLVGSGPSVLLTPLTLDPSLARAGQGALSCNGSNAYAHINGNPVDPNQPWSVSAWFKPSTGGAGLGTNRAFVFETGGSTYPISFGLLAGTNSTVTDFQVYTEASPGTGLHQDWYLPNAQVDQWHHLLLTYDPVAGVLNGYLDTVPAYSLVLGSGATLPAYTGFNLGTYRSANGRWFTGRIDEVAFWQRTLGAAAAVQLFALGNAGASVLTGAPVIQSFAPSAAVPGGFDLAWQAVPGLRYAIAASSNLLDWSLVLVTNYLATAPGTSVTVSPTPPPPTNAYYDPGLTGASQRFYRVEWTP